MDKNNLCIMMAPHLSHGDKPTFIYLIGNEVWISDFDTFIDSNFQHEYRIISIRDCPLEEEAEDAYWAYDYFYEACDISNRGPAIGEFEDRERRKYFMALWEFITGEKIIFKD